jgi:cell division protein FtsN
MKLTFPRAQFGGTLIGLIVGLLIGLGVALAVALYIAKVPVPFVDKVPHRTPEQDAAEAEHNKNWDPNAPLAGKPAPVPAPAASASESVQAPAPAAAAARAAAAPASAAVTSRRDPAAILAGESTDGAAPEAPRRAASSSREVADPFVYFVQAGAFSSADDAEQARARLAMQGLSARVSEREQGGRTVYRVRLGPFDSKEEAEGQQDRLKAAGSDSALVRLERTR